MSSISHKIISIVVCKTSLLKLLFEMLLPILFKNFEHWSIKLHFQPCNLHCRTDMFPITTPSQRAAGEHGGGHRDHCQWLPALGQVPPVQCPPVSGVVVIGLSSGVVLLAAVVSSVPAHHGWSASDDGHGSSCPLTVHPARSPHPGVITRVVDLQVIVFKMASCLQTMFQPILHSVRLCWTGEEIFFRKSSFQIKRILQCLRFKKI